MAGPESMADVMDNFLVQPLPSVGCATSIKLYLNLTEECMKEVQKMTSPRCSASTKFNNELCEYLADKFNITLQSARLSLEVSHHGTCLIPCSCVEVAKPDLKVFKRFLAIAKEVESFIQGCCQYAWIQAAMTLTNVSEHVSSLGFELELYRIAFSHSQRRLTSIEIHYVKKAEIEVVTEKASLDKKTLSKRVKAELRFLSDGEKELASLLLENLNPARTISAHSNSTGLSQHIIPEKVFQSGQKRANQCEVLGRGASTTVYKVNWLGIPVAKKIFHGQADNLFRREASMLGGLAHHNIMSLLEVGQNMHSCYIHMELMDTDLHTLVQLRLDDAEGQDSTPFSIHEAVDIMLQLGRGMKYLHENRIAHRDLKSTNVLVKEARYDMAEGFVIAKLADFGVYKTNQMSKTFTGMGTDTRWMAPEVINSWNMNSPRSTSDSEELLQVSSFESDVYSFAMVAYEIVTGDLPFSTISEQSVVKKVMNGDRPVLPYGLPNELKNLIQTCWAEKPSRRPKFAEICQALQYVKYLLVSEACGLYPPIQAPGLAGPSQSFPLARAFSLREQPQLLGEAGPSATGSPSERITPIPVPDSAGSSHEWSSSESDVSLRDQPQELEDGASTTFLPGRTTLNSVFNLASSSQCSSNARALTRRQKPLKLGRGSSATVFKVPYRGEDVAKKVFHGLDHPEFENEVSVLKLLSHPNIMSLIDSGKEKDNCYILMELMDGDLLQQMEEILEGNCDPFPFTIAEAVDIMLQVAQGMKYLHENKIVHGDLKSPNILIKLERGCLVVRVSDFGLAKTNKVSRTYADQVPNVGTERWMAPELIKLPIKEGDQLHGTPDGEKALKYPYKVDVYSYAMICSEILTGKRPFPIIGRSQEVLRKVLKGDRPDLPHYCPKKLKNLIVRCWAKDPSRRPTFADICEELKEILKCLQQTDTVQDMQIGLSITSSYPGRGMESGYVRTMRAPMKLRTLRRCNKPKRNVPPLDLKHKLDQRHLSMQKRFEESRWEDAHVQHERMLWSGRVRDYLFILVILLIVCIFYTLI